ncbi:MAG TPA: riboflavin synthase, partial [Oculatellaceae cyanobacterium]
CMTVIRFDAHSFSFEASPESLAKTNLSAFRPGRRVNLERPLTPSSRLGGHFVTGHVDGLARIVSVEPVGNSWVYEFEASSQELAELLVPKGSVAILGISLTVNTVSGNRFTVAIIPHTRTHTNLANYGVGDTVHIETDLLAKHVRRLLQGRQPETAESPLIGALDDGATIDAPTLVPALNALAGNRPTPRIHTGNWFCHDPENH